MKFSIEGRPASKKNSRNIFYKNGRIFNLPSNAYKKFKKKAGNQLVEVKAEYPNIAFPISQPVCVKVLLKQKGKYNQDIDNALASLLDILESYSVIKNDDLVKNIQVERQWGYNSWSSEVEINIL